ncbi:MAG: Ig-like domain-containing protein [Planctomycetota bacterium]|nr:Ig-like domain-containing protein [Planctomycetota bacterium]
MALNIVSVSPADGAINWPLDTNLTIVFDANVVKGQGTINVVRDSTNTLGVAVDVNSPIVTISGATVTVDLPENLLPVEAYHVFIDSGAFLDTSSTQTPAATVFTQNFDLLPLNPFVSYDTTNVGDGTDFTLVPPINMEVDNSLMPTGGIPEFRGWSFMDKQPWINEAGAGGGQSRDQFTLGSGTVAVGDPDQFDDTTNGGPFNGYILTKPISLAGVAANTAVIEFDSSFRPEDSQIGELEVRFDGGAWKNLLTLNPSNTVNDAPSATVVNSNINEHIKSGTNTLPSSQGKGNIPVGAVGNPSTASNMQFRWHVTGKNTWWWAIDNLKVTATVTGVPFTGISDPTTWNLDIPRLAVGIDKASMSENGGSAVGTVTRNGTSANWNDPLVVSLASNDTTEATVPTSVTILAGQASKTFAITAVDDTLSDRTQTAVITASATGFASGSKSILVLDDEGPKVVSLNPADNATGVDYKSNLVMTFDVPIKKGNGLVNIVRTTGNVVVASLNVNDPAITVAASVVTIDPPVNLNGLTDYYVLVDDGAFIDATLPALPSSSILLNQNFSLTSPGTTAPTGFTVTDGGWNFVDKSSFVAAGGSSNFAGQGTLAVTTAQDSFLQTTPIDLSGITIGSVALEFDASYSGGVPKLGAIQVSTDGGSSWNDVAQLSSSVGNTRVVINKTGVTGATPLGSPFSNPASGSLMFRFGQVFNSGGYLAIDNLKITGETQGAPFVGFQAVDQWNFTTAVAPTLTVTINKTSMSENGGTAIGTVTSNLAVASPLTVQLASSDITAATVPVSVVLPAGPAGTSIAFPIIAVDDTVGDGTQRTVISASATDYFSVSASIDVLDDDFPKATALSPADNATAVPVGANLVVTFDQNVKKGNGFVHIIRKSDGKSEQSIDIQSSLVTISGAVVTINPSVDLVGLTDYSVSFEEGAILSATNAVKIGASLLSQDFELLTLKPAVFETVGLTPNGKDFTATPPTGYSVDNSLMPPGGVPEWNGWTFAAKSFWSAEGGQSRANFALGNNTIAVGDTDEWDDTVTLNNSFNSLFLTSPINLTTVVAGTAVLDFDSSFRPEDSQIGKLDVTYDGGTTWNNLLTLDPSNTSNSTSAANINEHRTIALPEQPNGGSMQFRWGVTGANDWWWAIDNIKVTGNTNGLSYPGIANTDATTWNFTTAEASMLSVSVAPTTIAENGGTAVVTVTRNLVTSGSPSLVVNLTSSDTASATVPSSVTIPAGQASATFTLTAVDDSVADGLKNVTITASTPGFVSGTTIVPVTDNEVADVVISEFMYNPAAGAFNNATKAEWIEVVNRGSVTADLSNWTIDDEDLTNWGPIALGTTLAPGQVAVLYNQVVSGVSPATFRAAWNVPSTAVVVGMFWGDLGNTPSAVGTLNENILLLDSGKATIDQANYDDDGVIWPANVAVASIYLKIISTDNNVGTNWRSSVVGTDGVINPVQVGTPAATVYALTDKGSPGIVPNSDPVVAANSSAVSGNEGTTITNAGTWSDPDVGNVVTLTASVGTIVKNANGTWNWSLVSTDQVAATTVTITANDGVGGTAYTTFTYTVNNVAPVLTRANATVTGNVQTSLTNTGTYFDVPADTVTLTADIGTIVKNGDGTWSWSFTPVSAVSNQVVTITGSDEDGGSSSVTFTITANSTVATRATRYLGAQGSSASTSLATDKVALLPGQSSTYANYTNYSLGLNSVVVDVNGLPAATTNAQLLASLQFAQWDGIAAAGFVPLPSAAVPSASILAGGGVGGSARVTITFPDNTVQNTWLQVTVLANANTGLSANDVFYFGNVIGELNTGNTDTRYRVNALDTSAVRNNQSTGANSVGVTNIYDVNRDGRVNALDTSVVRNNQQTSGLVAPITAPSARPATSSFGSGSFGNGSTVGTGGNSVGSGVPFTGVTSKNDSQSNSASARTDAFLAPAQLVLGDAPLPLPISVNSSDNQPLDLDLSVDGKKEPSKLGSIDDFFASFWNLV